MTKTLSLIGLFAVLLATNWTDSIVLAQNSAKSVYLELRPPCLDYEFPDEIETTPPANLSDIIMNDEELLDEDNYTCYPFGEQDFENRISPYVQVGDTIAIDLVINNTAEAIDILEAGAWLTYDSEILEGIAVSINESIFDSTPGEANFDKANNLVKIEVESKASEIPLSEWIPIGRIYFEVIKAPTAGNTIISFAEGENASETFVEGLPDGETLDDVLAATPQSLILQIAESSSSSSVVSSSTSSSLKAAEASCTTDGQCQSNLCYLNTCQAVGYTLPGGASCRNNEQCTSNICNRGGTCQAVAGSSDSSSVTNTVSSTSISSDSSPSSASISSDDSESSAAQVPEGGFCSYSADCLTGVCYQGSCMATDFKIPDGGYCETDTACASGSCLSNSCSETSRTTDTDICSSNADCDNKRCDNGQCVPLLNDNQACQEDSDCSSNSCLIGICTSDASLPNGSSCQIDAQCASDFCLQGICSEEPDPLNQENTTPTLGGVGTSCSQNADCGSQLCLEGICRAADDQQAQRTAFGLIQVQNFRVTTAGSTVYLAWDNLQSSWKAAYNIYYSSTSGRYLQRKTVSGADTNLVINDLPEGTQYYFAVRAVSITNEESAFSNEISVVVGNPSTSTAPLTASSIFNPVPGNEGTNPINPDSAGEMPGETGLPAAAGLVLLFSAVAGTAFATKRQFVSLTEPHER